MIVSDNVADFVSSAPHLGYPPEAVVDAIAVQTGEFGGFTVLDVGCGFGHLSRAVAVGLDQAIVLGVDAESVAINQAQRLTHGLDIASRVSFRTARLDSTNADDLPRHDVIVFSAAQQAFVEPSRVRDWRMSYGSRRAVCVLDRSAVVLPGRTDHELSKFAAFEAELGARAQVVHSHKQLLSVELSCELLNLLDGRLAPGAERDYLERARVRVLAGEIAWSEARLYVIKG